LVIDVSGPNTGNVGIGTTAPGAKLDVNGTSYLRGLISTSGDAIELNSLGSGDRNSFIDFHSQDGVDNSARIIREPGANANFNFINGSSVMSLTPTGNVGIGAAATAPTSTLQVAGSVATPIRRVTAATTLAATDYTLLCNTTTAGFTVTLPAANSATGRIYVIRKTDETNNVLTFSSAIKLSETNTFTTLNYLKTIRIQSDGTDWVVID
jgi:hypothetical protein